MRLVNTLMELLVLWGLYESSADVAEILGRARLGKRKMRSYDPSLSACLNVRRSPPRRTAHIETVCTLCETIFRFLKLQHFLVFLPKYLRDLVSVLVRLSLSCESPHMDNDETSREPSLVLAQTMEQLPQTMRIEALLFVVQTKLASTCAAETTRTFHQRLGILLSHEMQQPGGIVRIVAHFLGHVASNNTKGKRGELHVAKLIATPPLQSNSRGAYFKRIAAQMMRIFRHVVAKQANEASSSTTDESRKEEKQILLDNPELHVRVCVLAIDIVASRLPKSAEKYFITPMTRPLCLWGRLTRSKDLAKSLQTAETDIKSGLLMCRLLLNDAVVVTPKLIRVLVGGSDGSRLAAMFHLCCTAQRMRSHLKRLSESVLRLIFQKFSDALPLEWLRRIGHVPRPRGLAYAPGETGGVTLRFDVATTTTTTWALEAKTLIELLDDGVQRGSLFVTCLQEFVRMRRLGDLDASRMRCTETSALVDRWPDFCGQLVAYMANSIGPSVLAGKSQIVKCLHTLIASLGRVCAPSFDSLRTSNRNMDATSIDQETTTAVELLTMCVQLLVGVLYSSLDKKETTTSEDSVTHTNAELRKMLPILERLVISLGDRIYPELASMLSTSVEFIVVNCKDEDGRRNEKSATKCEDGTSRTTSPLATTSSPTPPPTLSTRTTPAEQLKRALSDAHSPIVPICAHGLGMLHRMMKSTQSLRDDDTDSIISTLDTSFDEILLVLLTSLSHDESYVYLSSIKGLTVLADRFVIRTLNALFDEVTFRSEDIRGLSWLNRKLRVVEVLDRIVERLGRTLPPHAPRFVSVLSACATRFPPPSSRFDMICKSEYDDLVVVAATLRSSSLSTLGTVCKTLALHAIPSLPQLLRLCANASRPIIEPDPRVRRAANCLLCQLVEGRDPDEFVSASDGLTEVRDTLSRSRDSETDPLASGFAARAASEIAQILRSYLTPKSKREFRIRIM